jgi:hypothetical protein
MGRRVSNGVVGAAGTIGQLSVSGNTLTTTQTNTNLIIDPQGTGITQFVGNLQTNGNTSTGGEIRLMDADSSNYIAIRAIASVGTNRTLQFPDSVGNNGHVLTTDGANPATLSWVAQTAAGVTITDQNSSSSDHYLYFGTTASSQLTSANVSATVTRTLKYIPLSGTLISIIGQHPTMQGTDAAASSGTASLTIRGTANATKNTGANGSILMNDGVASSSTVTGTLVITGGLGVSGRINAANFDGIVGANSAAAGTFTTLTETSSITLKENLRPIDSALDKLAELTGYIYDRKDGSSYDEAGLIAEQVYKVIPELVTKNQNGDPFGIHYTKLTAYLIEAIKSLRTEIKILKGE